MDHDEQMMVAPQDRFIYRTLRSPNLEFLDKQLQDSSQFGVTFQHVRKSNIMLCQASFTNNGKSYTLNGPNPSSIGYMIRFIQILIVLHKNGNHLNIRQTPLQEYFSSEMWLDDLVAAFEKRNENYTLNGTERNKMGYLASGRISKQNCVQYESEITKALKKTLQQLYTARHLSLPRFANIIRVAGIEQHYARLKTECSNINPESNNCIRKLFKLENVHPSAAKIDKSEVDNLLNTLSKNVYSMLDQANSNAGEYALLCRSGMVEESPKGLLAFALSRLFIVPELKHRQSSHENISINPDDQVVTNNNLGAQFVSGYHTAGVALRHFLLGSALVDSDYAALKTPRKPILKQKLEFEERFIRKCERLQQACDLIQDTRYRNIPRPKYGDLPFDQNVPRYDTVGVKRVLDQGEEVDDFRFEQNKRIK